jgi:hypothetical protein
MITQLKNMGASTFKENDSFVASDLEKLLCAYPILRIIALLSMYFPSIQGDWKITASKYPLLWK